MEILQAIFDVFVTLVGFPAFLMALINLLKLLKVLPDGAANAFNFWGNVIFFGVVAFFVFTGQGDTLSWLDGILAGAAKLIADVIIILGGFTASTIMTRQYHLMARGLPVIGKSHSLG